MTKTDKDCQRLPKTAKDSPAVMPHTFSALVRIPIMEAYDRLVKLVQDAEEDIRKAEGGNKAAGTRVRKTMQEIKKASQDVRVAVLELRGDE